MTTKELQSHGKVVLMEWISTIAIFISCFAYLSHKIDKQCERTDRISEQQNLRSDRLYEMFIDLLKDKKQ